MMTEHVTVWMLTCLMLTGASYASIVRSLQGVNVQRDSPRQPDWNQTFLPKPAPYDPPQCSKLACPPATVEADRGSYRVVYFPEAVYAKVRVEGEAMMPALFASYERLRKYYAGDNDRKEKLPMTAPVILRVDPGEPSGMFNPRNFTLFFYMDPTVKSPPVPDEKITVLEVNSYTLYIRTFSSYTVTYADWMRELLLLAADVEADGKPYKKGYFYFATYDSPFRFTERTNEVQLLVPRDDAPGL